MINREKINDVLKKTSRRNKWEKYFIRQEPNKFKKILKFIWYYTKFPFILVWDNRKDPIMIISLISSFIILSSEVWLSAILGFISWGTDFSKWCFGIAGACWAFWMGPFTPFTALAVGFAFVIRKFLLWILGKKSKSS